MLEHYLACGYLRGCQVLINAAIWIAVGCFIAGVFKRMLGPSKTRMLFGEGTRYGLLIGWLVGMLLPVCSLGVIPVVREMHRVGIKGGTIIAFGLTAPLFNPISVLYGLTLSDPIAILVFTFSALVIVTSLGFAWDLIFPKRDDPPEDPELPTVGMQRSVALLDSTSRELLGPTLVFLLIGITGSVLLAMLVPKGALQAETEPDKFFAPVVMSFVMTPVYATPLQAMGQIGSMFQHGNSVGAAFSLLILGAGANIGLLTWFAAAFGIKRVFLFLGMLISITVILAYCMDKPLYPKGVQPSGHTHAFDIYTHPFTPNQEDQLQTASLQLADFREKNDFGTSYLLVALVLMALTFSLVRTFVDLEKWYVVKKETKGGFDIILPGWFLGGTTIVSLVVASVIGTYLYYPPADQLLSELREYNANCVIASKSKDWEGVKKWVPYCEDLSRRLEVGVFLREGSVSEFRSTVAANYRENLDTLRDAIEVQNYHESDELGQQVANSYMQLSRAFRKQKPADDEE